MKMIICECGQQAAQTCTNKKCARCCSGTNPCQRHNKRKFIEETSFDIANLDPGISNATIQPIEEFYAENDRSYDDLQAELQLSCTEIFTWDIVQYIICDFLDERDRCVECGKAAGSDNFCCDCCEQVFCWDWCCTEIYSVGKHSFYCSDCYAETMESEEEEV